MDNDRVYKMKFGKVYAALVQKAERKGRTRAEVDELIHWLLGYSCEDIKECLAGDVSMEEFFTSIPKLNDNVDKVTGVICGYRVEEIADPVMRNIRRLDKIVDELAKGKSMDKILRK
ncbi:MAG: DUF2200 domain-containing protein [Defluviitaleaceae bacterium]|nr:DUF2200 domain-containing protein [Defluviitaleaceae bacterium]